MRGSACDLAHVGELWPGFVAVFPEPLGMLWSDRHAGCSQLYARAI